eukprot:125571_1
MEQHKAVTEQEMVQLFAQNIMNLFAKNKRHAGFLPYMEIQKYLKHHQESRQLIMEIIRSYLNPITMHEIPLNIIMQYTNYPQIKNVNKSLQSKWPEFITSLKAMTWFKRKTTNKNKNKKELITRWIDVNYEYDLLCKQYHFKSRLKRINRIKKALDLSCKTCKVDILPRSTSQKWIIIQRKFGRHDTTTRLFDAEEFKMIVIECKVNANSGEVDIMCGDHGEFSIEQEWLYSYGYGKGDCHQIGRKACPALQMIMEQNS